VVQRQGQELEVQGQGLVNWSLMILKDKDFPRGQQHCNKIGIFYNEFAKQVIEIGLFGAYWSMFRMKPGGRTQCLKMSRQ